MKRILLCVLVLSTFLFAQLSAADSKTPATVDQLEQQYMAKRAEWVALRSVAMEKIREAKTEAEKRSIREKLTADEHVLRAASANLGRQLREAKQTKLAKPAVNSSAR